jgi:UDP-N-acetylglucosamine 2-epimerase (non-hydrolysing)
MVSEDSGLINLKKEGIPEERVFYVGNLMIESLIRTKPRWEDIPLPAAILPVTGQSFILATFHRPENVDEKKNLEILLGQLNEISIHYPILFPIHPRTRNRIRVFDLERYLENKNIIFCDPLGYFEFIRLINLSAIVLTDSGGIQEETTYLKIPCLTVRNNTERPSTLRQGTNRLIRLLENNWLQIIEDHQVYLTKNRPEPIRFWDDQVSQRILEVIHKVLK